MSTSGMSTTNIMDRSRVSSTAGSDATRRAYLAHAHRRRPPPRFRPYMIIILVLSGGLLLIGLTMTIIGLWPSYSPSGGNPLQIVGPLMLGLGLLGLIGSIGNICYKREQEKKQTMKTISDMRSSRMTLASQHSQALSMGHPVTPTPSVHARPSKGILKASSTSTYNGTARNSEYESDSGMANTHSFSTNRSYERDSNASDNSRNLDNIRVEMMPDPTAYRHGKPVDQSSTGSDQGVPPASMGSSRGYRQPSSNKQGRSSKPNYNNQAYSPDARETDIDGDLSNNNQRRQMQSYDHSGYDAYDPSNVSGGGLTGGGITGGGALGTPSGALGSPYGTPQQAATPVSRQPKPQQPNQPPQPQYQPPQPQQQYQAPQPQPQQQRARWGSKSPRTPTGQANLSYTEEQQVSTVSAAYQQATQQYDGTPTSSSQRHYTSYAHSGGAPTNNSSSTEV